MPQDLAFFQQIFVDLRWHNSTDAVVKLFSSNIFNTRSFARGFGRYVSGQRRKIVWPKENGYFLANNCIKMPSSANLIDEVFDGNNANNRFYACRSRRLFINSYPFIRLEIAFNIRDSRDRRYINFSEIARSILSQRICFDGPSEKTPYSLGGNSTTSYLRKRLIRSLSETSAQQDHKLMKASGKQLCCEYEYASENLLSIPKRAVDGIVYLNGIPVRLTHFKQKHGDDTVNVWFIGKLADTSETAWEEIRQFRIGLLKINAEFEGIRTLISNLHSIDEKDDHLLRRRINYSIEALLGVKWGDWNYGPGGRFVLNCFERATSSSIQELISSVREVIELDKGTISGIDNFIKQISKNGVTIMTDNSTHIGGSINISGKNGTNVVTIGSGNTISDISTKINEGIKNSGVDEELAKLIADVNTKLIDVVNALGEDSKIAGKIKRDITDLAAAATEEKPDKEFLNITADGLISAAKTVSSIVSGPAIDAIKSLINLFP